MEYEVKDVTWVGTPKGNKDDPTKVDINVNVTTGVVGDTYGFVKVDTIKVQCALSMTGTEMQASVNSQALQFSQGKYPNT